MKNIDFKEKFNELNSNKFHYVFDDATGTLMLDENMNLNNVQLPEGYTLGADKNQGFGIYNSDSERILNIDDYGLNSLFDDEEESEELTSEQVGEEESEELTSEQVGEEESEELTSEQVGEEESEELTSEQVGEEESEELTSEPTDEEEYDLDNKKIKKIDPSKKQIFHKLSVPFIFIKEKVKHLGSKIKNKSKSQKEEYDLKPVKIPTITKIEKKGLKKLSKKDNEIKLSKEYREWLSFKSLNLDEKIDKYLEKTDVGNDLLIQIYKLVDFIIDNRKGMETEKEIDIHKFLNENINIPSEEKLEKFVNFLKENALLIYNLKVTVIRKMLDNHNLDNNKEIQQLFNELIETEDFFKVQQLYNFMKKNVENEDFEKELLKKMYSILGKTRSESNLNNNEAEKEVEEKARKEAEEKARKEAEEKARKEAEEKARKEAEEKARKEAEEKARKEAEEKARKEAEEKARIDYTLNVLEKCGINMSIPEHVYGNSNSYKNIYILLKLAKLYGSEEELEKAKDIYNNDYNTFTIS